MHRSRELVGHLNEGRIVTNLPPNAQLFQVTYPIVWVEIRINSMNGPDL